jgi:hypothetical protein
MNESPLTEYTYLGLGFYVQPITDKDDRVLVFTVTRRDERLKAKVPVPNLGMDTDDAQPVELTWDEAVSRTAHGSLHRSTPLLGRTTSSVASATTSPIRGTTSPLLTSWNEAGSGSYASSIEPIEAFGSEVDAKDTETFLDSDGGKALRHEVAMNTYGLTAPYVKWTSLHPCTAWTSTTSGFSTARHPVDKCDE